MTHIKVLFALILSIMAVSLFSWSQDEVYISDAEPLGSQPTIEVYIQQPDSFEKAFLSALEDLIVQEGDFTLDHSYRDGDFDTAEYKGRVFEALDDTSEMGFVVFANILKLEGTTTPQVAIALDYTAQGMMFYSEMFQTRLGIARELAETVYYDKLMFFHPVLAMLETHDVERNKDTLSANMNISMAEIVQFWRTPASQGGAGQSLRYLTVPNVNYWTNLPFDFDSGYVEVISIQGYVVKVRGVLRRDRPSDPEHVIIGVVDCKTGMIHTYDEGSR